MVGAWRWNHELENKGVIAADEQVGTEEPVR